MIPLHHAKGKSFALFGLGSSGIATAKALLAGGAGVVVWDDSEAGRDEARRQGLDVRDLKTENFSRFDSFILSPGVPLTHPEPHWSAKLAAAANVEIIGDIELFCRERRHSAPDSKLVAITGTNGKSTTTALTAHILQSGALPVQMGGNIGRPALDLELRRGQLTVLECSSYQIDLAPSLDPDVGILLNLTEDHLDRHGTMDHYGAVKARLIEGVPETGLAIIGVDDPWCAQIAKHARMKGTPLCAVSLKHEMPDGIWLNNSALYETRDGAVHEIVDLATCPALRGAHNAQNAACAFAAARQLGLDDQTILGALRSFPGLAHRMQRVGHVGKVVFVNDSKATNADAAAKALASFTQIFWIAGGRAKTGGIESLKTFFPIMVHAYLIGEAAPAFAESLQGKVEATMSGTIENAVAQALKDAQSSDLPYPVVLLSPACASFDQFKNFETRGEAFVAAVRSLPGFEEFG